MAISRIDQEILFHQVARILAYCWALTKPGDDFTEIIIKNEDYNEIEQFIPLGREVKVTLELNYEGEDEWENS